MASSPSFLLLHIWPSEIPKEQCIFNELTHCACEQAQALFDKTWLASKTFFLKVRLGFFALFQIDFITVLRALRVSNVGIYESGFLFAVEKVSKNAAFFGDGSGFSRCFISHLQD